MYITRKLTCKFLTGFFQTQNIDTSSHDKHLSLNKLAGVSNIFIVLKLYSSSHCFHVIQTILETLQQKDVGRFLWENCLNQSDLQYYPDPGTCRWRNYIIMVQNFCSQYSNAAFKGRLGKWTEAGNNIHLPTVGYTVSKWQFLDQLMKIVTLYCNEALYMCSIHNRYTCMYSGSNPDITSFSDYYKSVFTFFIAYCTHTCMYSKWLHQEKNQPAGLRKISAIQWWTLKVPHSNLKNWPVSPGNSKRQ